MKILRIPLVIALVFVAGWAFNAGAQTETNLYSFGSSPHDGALPEAALVKGSDGNFYGTTDYGGTNNNGTVFRISPSGTYTSLYSFTGYPTDGGNPEGGLVQGSDGNFYGTTALGGTLGVGTVFRISPSGTYTNLYSFTGYPNGPDGAYADSGLVQGSDGNLYGTTAAGGIHSSGTVYRISFSGIYTNLYSFRGFPDGAEPFVFGGLVQGIDGNLYGTTWRGGTHGDGTVFRISPSGTYTSLYSFAGYPNAGNGPFVGLVQGSDGNFYGTTIIGGTNNQGTVFRISPSGTNTTLYMFVGSPTDGNQPRSGLVQGSDGNLYGATQYGGIHSTGTVFRISPSGSYTNLYSFGGYPTDGNTPWAGLVQGSDGNFYGTTTIGGTYNSGTVFRISVPLKSPPYPINQITGVGLSGTNVVFNVPSIAGETYQLQFSSSMNPTNWVNEGGTITSIGALLTLTNFGGAVGPQGFYRLAITP
ncbi:MAG: choice-of-anchor tandem repeat GloVer-containing protein [Verrucomicrobiia bacterium]|jgi:uncharacterized repeat protein (TIGR03803 family)